MLGEHGVDGSAHRSYQLDPASLSAADVVLTMESSHVQKATQMMPEAFAKVLPLKEAVSLVSAQRSRVTIESLLDAANVNRDPRSYLGTAWDVSDPYKKKIKVYRNAVTEIGSLVDQLLARLQRAQ